MSDFQLPLEKKQEQFSLAYVQAVASTAGYTLEEIRVDYDSIDLSIMQRGDGDDCPEIDTLRVQLKCTYEHRPTDSHLAFPLKIKNYNDLRRDTAYPRILVVICVPDDVTSWLDQSDDALVLHHCGYWVSLRGMPPTSNSSSVTVHLPVKQQFSVPQLETLMNSIAQGQLLCS